MPGGGERLGGAEGAGGGGTVLNGKSAVPLLSKRNDVTREWLVTRHSRIQLQIAFAPNGPAAMFQFAAAGRKTCSCDDFNIADRLSRGLRRDTLERTRAGLVCLPLARVLRRLSSFDVLLVTDHLFPHPHFKLELRFSFICRKWNIDIVFAELNGILLCLADQDTFREKKMECTIY